MNSTITTAISYPENLRNINKYSQTLAAAQPAVMETFEKLHQAAGAEGALDRKT